MLGALDLVDHVVHIVITVEITLAAVCMLCVLLLVFDHRRLRLEVLIASRIGAFDLHCSSDGGSLRNQDDSTRLQR
jgi:hypothetical protein